MFRHFCLAGLAAALAGFAMGQGVIGGIIGGGPGGQSAQPSAVRAEDRGLIRGRVLDAAGKGIAGAAVSFQLPGPRVHRVVTNHAGDFTAAQLEPGQYEIVAEAPGFVPGRPASRYVPLGAGKSVDDLKIALTPQGVITGRAVHGQGTPVSGLRIVAWNVLGSRTVVHRTLTDHRGEFRLHSLAPGVYWLATAEQTQHASLFAYREGGTFPTDSPPSYELFLPTYYPSALTTDEATPVRALAGETTSGIVIQVRRGRTVSIAGRVDTSAYRPGYATGTALTLVSRNPGERDGAPRALFVKADGSFEDPSVAPGEYTLQAPFAAPGGRARTLYVPPAGLSGVSLDPEAALEIPVAWTVPGGLAPGHRLTVSLFRDGHSSVLTPLGPGGSSQLKVPAVGTLRLQLHQQVSPGVEARSYYLKSAFWGTRDVLKSGLDASQPAKGPLKIELAPGGRRVTGTVAKPAGAVSSVSVALWLSGPAGHFAPFHQVELRGDSLAFEFTALPPGSYRLAAFCGDHTGPVALAYARGWHDQATPVAVSAASQQAPPLKCLPVYAEAP